MAESQQTYPYNEIIENSSKAQWIEYSLSEERLAPYMTRSGYDHNKALNQYLYNARLSKALLFPLHALEITLRNRIKWVFSKAFECENWHQNETLRDMLNQKGLDALNKAEDKAIANSSSNNIDDVVANSTFELWTFLLHGQYHDFWRKNFSKLCSPGISRGQLFDRIKKANDFRNRIAHHEPIVDKPFYDRYQDILTALSFLNPEVKSWVEAHSTVDMVIASEPAPTGNPKPLLKEKADVDFKIVNSPDPLFPLPSERFIYCEDRELMFDLREVAKYLTSQADEENILLLELNNITFEDIINARKLKKNTSIFGETENYRHAKALFRGKRVKYIVVKNVNDEIKGVIEKPHRQI